MQAYRVTALDPLIAFIATGYPALETPALLLQSRHHTTPHQQQQFNGSIIR